MTAVPQVVLVVGFFRSQQRDDLVEFRVSHHVKADHLHLPFAGALAGE